MLFLELQVTKTRFKKLIQLPLQNKDFVKKTGGENTRKFILRNNAKRIQRDQK